MQLREIPSGVRQAVLESVHQPMAFDGVQDELVAAVVGTTETCANGDHGPGVCHDRAGDGNLLSLGDQHRRRRRGLIILGPHLFGNVSGGEGERRGRIFEESRAAQQHPEQPRQSSERLPAAHDDSFLPFFAETLPACSCSVCRPLKRRAGVVVTTVRRSFSPGMPATERPVFLQVFFAASSSPSPSRPTWWTSTAQELSRRRRYATCLIATSDV